MKESDLQKQILDYLDLKRIFHYRNNSGGGLAQAFSTQKKRVPCPSRVLGERAGLLAGIDGGYAECMHPVLFLTMPSKLDNLNERTLSSR